MKVSLVTPTYNREKFHPRIIKCFDWQSYGDIEWIVLDDSPTPSTSFSGLNRANVKYYHTTEKALVGDKRNWLAEKCSGDLIAHFDDDDFYGPDYISTMVEALESRALDFMNLRGWFVHDLRSRFLGYWDLTQKTGLHYVCGKDGVASQYVDSEDYFGQNELGWGFGFLYRKRVWDEIRFPSQGWNEDGVFSVAAHNKFRAGGLIDTNGICLHEIHGGNSSRSFPQYHMPSFLIDRIFPKYEEVAVTP